MFLFSTLSFSQDDSKEYFDPEAPLIEMIASVELAESAFTTVNEDSSVKVQRRIFEVCSQGTKLINTTYSVSS